MCLSRKLIQITLETLKLVFVQGPKMPSSHFPFLLLWWTNIEFTLKQVGLCASVSVSMLNCGEKRNGIVHNLGGIKFYYEKFKIYRTISKSIKNPTYSHELNTQLQQVSTYSQSCFICFCLFLLFFWKQILCIISFYPKIFQSISLQYVNCFKK